MANFLNEEIKRINFLLEYKQGVVIYEQPTQTSLSDDELKVLGYLKTIMDKYGEVKPSSPEEFESNIGFNNEVIELAKQLISKKEGEEYKIDPLLYNTFLSNMKELYPNDEDLRTKGESVKSMSYNTTN
jgi:hypothetical protein